MPRRRWIGSLRVRTYFGTESGINALKSQVNGAILSIFENIYPYSAFFKRGCLIQWAGASGGFAAGSARRRISTSGSGGRGRIGVAAVARDREDRRRDGLLRVLVDAQLEAVAREAGGRRFGDGGRRDEQRGREEGSFRSVHGVAEWTRGDHGAVFA